MMTSRTSFALLCFGVALGLTMGMPQGRLLGGEDAEMAEFPYVASLRLNKAPVCTCTIISTTKVLTAAHCVSELGLTAYAVEKLSLRVGSINQFAGGSIVNVKEVKIHPSYGNFLHDLAILTLSEPLVFSTKINKITLPAPIEAGEDVEEVPANGTPVYVTGWGEQLDGTSNYKLQKANMNTVSKPFCELSAGYGYDSTLCLSSGEKEGVARGDDGAPVVDDNGVLVGIVSFFFGEGGTKYPDVSTRVAYYLDWIADNE